MYRNLIELVYDLLDSNAYILDCKLHLCAIGDRRFSFNYHEPPPPHDEHPPEDEDPLDV